MATRNDKILQWSEHLNDMIKKSGKDYKTIGNIINVMPKTVFYWMMGANLPSRKSFEKLRKVFPNLKSVTEYGLHFYDDVRKEDSKVISVIVPEEMYNFLLNECIRRDISIPEVIRDAVRKKMSQQ